MKEDQKWLNKSVCFAEILFKKNKKAGPWKHGAESGSGSLKSGNLSCITDSACVPDSSRWIRPFFPFNSGQMTGPGILRSPL
jgi:hypothetical protein